MSNLYKFISLKAIIDRIMNDPVMADLNIDTAVIQAVDCIQIIANPSFFDRKVAKLEVANNRAIVPYNMTNIVKVVRIDEDNNRTSMHSIADPFYKRYPYRSDEGLNNNTEQYKIQGDYIYTNFTEGTLHMAYDAIPLDNDGFIMIPDNANIIKAVEFYIKHFHYHVKWVTDKLSGDKFAWVEKNKDWYIGKAQSAQLMEGLDTARGLSNVLSRLITTEDAHQTDYKFSNNKEYRRIYR